MIAIRFLSGSYGRFWLVGTGFLLPFLLILVMELNEYYRWPSLTSLYCKQPGRVLVWSLHNVIVSCRFGLFA